MYNILVIHCYHGEYPIRQTSGDWLSSFRRYSGHRVFYLNLYFFNIPWYIKKIEWDLIIFSHLFTSERWGYNEFKKTINKARPLKKSKATKILFNQDEFFNTNILCDFVNEFGIEIIFSCANESEWKKIYPTVNFQKVRFYTVLTGYIDDFTVRKIDSLMKTNPERTIGIGYRACNVPASFGRHGQMKIEIAKRFSKFSQDKNLRMDISLRREDMLLGDEWYKFLFHCYYTIGVEGGASYLDSDGSMLLKTNQFVSNNPDSTFDEIEETCFPGKIGRAHV